jgi:hypothetical protein
MRSDKGWLLRYSVAIEVYGFSSQFSLKFVVVLAPARGATTFLLQNLSGLTTSYIITHLLVLRWGLSLLNMLQ